MQLYEIGMQVAQRRTALQLSQKQLGKLAGLSRLTISELETGSLKDLGIAKVLNLLNILGIELKTEAKPSKRGLFKTAVAANVSYQKTLTQEGLVGALASGEIPSGYEAQMSAILDEAPLPAVVKAVEEAALQTGVKPKRMWKHLANWSRELRLYRHVWQ